MYIYIYSRREDYKKRVQVVIEDNHIIAKMEKLTEFEQYLIAHNILIFVKKENGAMVPIIIPRDLKLGMDWLYKVSTRMKCNITLDNPYLFASGGELISYIFCLMSVSMKF